MSIFLFRKFSGVPEIQDNPIYFKGVYLPYQEFRKNLQINYRKLMGDMLLPWIMISASLLFFSIIKGTVLNVFFTIPISLFIAFWLHSYTCYFHEAAHFNLHKNKKINDLIALTILTPFTGMFINKYRVTHWDHHRYHGCIEDTEISYRKPINIFFIIGGLSGLNQLNLLRRYIINFSNVRSRSVIESSSNHMILSILIYLAFQLLIIYCLQKYLSSSSAISWFIAVFFFTPIIGQIRQILEHRPLSANKKDEFNTKEHSPTNRIFGKSFFSRHFGAAGFNSHLLHHLDPSISYTSFQEMEDFLLNTPAKNYINENRTGYFSCIKRLCKE